MRHVSVLQGQSMVILGRTYNSTLVLSAPINLSAIIKFELHKRSQKANPSVMDLEIAFSFPFSRHNERRSLKTITNCFPPHPSITIINAKLQKIRFKLRCKPSFFWGCKLRRGLNTDRSWVWPVEKGYLAWVWDALLLLGPSGMAAVISLAKPNKQASFHTANLFLRKHGDPFWISYSILSTRPHLEWG